jgi:hypothetical protein
MGQVDDAQVAAKARRHQLGSGRASGNASAGGGQHSQSLFGTAASGRGGKRFNWAGEDGETIVALIDLVTSRGGAVRFGYSRDGCAGSVGVYLGDSRDTLWINPEDESAIVFGKITALFSAMADRSGVSPSSD